MGTDGRTLRARLLLFAGLLAALFVPATAFGGEAGEEGEKEDGPVATAALETRLATRLRETVSRIRRTREDRYRLEARHEAERRSLEERIAELEAQEHALDVRARKLRGEVRARTSETAAVRQETEETRTLLEKVHGVLRDECKDLLTFIAASLPFRKKERIEAVRSFRQDRDSTLPEKFRTLQAILEYETALGATSEAFRGRVTLGKERRPRARILRLGHATMAFITEDGKTSGILAGMRNRMPVWKTDLSFRERWDVKKAMEILERRRPPVFIRYPIMVLDVPNTAPGENREDREKEAGR